jgi:hypothetical protein
VFCTGRCDGYHANTSSLLQNLRSSGSVSTVSVSCALAAFILQDVGPTCHWSWAAILGPELSPSLVASVLCVGACAPFCRLGPVPRSVGWGLWPRSVGWGLCPVLSAGACGPVLSTGAFSAPVHLRDSRPFGLISQFGCSSCVD